MHLLVEHVAVLFENPWILFGAFLALAALNIVFPPLPLESAVVIAGYLTGIGHGSVAAVISAAVLGTFLGSLWLYYLTRRYGYEVIARTPLKKVISRESFDKAVLWFKKYGILAVFIGKLIPGMSLYSVVCSGTLRLHPLIALPAIFLSNLVFFTVLALLGRDLGENWIVILNWLQRLGYWLLIACGTAGVALLVFWVCKRNQPKSEK